MGQQSAERDYIPGLDNPTTGTGALVLERPKQQEQETGIAFTMARAEIESAIATAKAYPRNIAEFKSRALAMVTMDFDTAKSCIYYRKVGRDEDTGEQKIASGESIRMAEIVMSCYGNLMGAATMMEQTPRMVRYSAMVRDLETNVLIKAEWIEATVKRTGEPYSERQRAVVAAVCQSKALRNAIFRVVPKALCKFIREAAEKVVRGEQKPFAERRTAMLDYYRTKWGVSKERILAELKLNSVEAITEDHIVMLHGIANSIIDGDSQVDEAFPPVAAEKNAKVEPKAPQKPPTDKPKAQQEPPTEKAPEKSVEPAEEKAQELKKARVAPRTAEKATEDKPEPQTDPDDKTPEDKPKAAEDNPEPEKAQRETVLIGTFSLKSGKAPGNSKKKEFWINITDGLDALKRLDVPDTLVEEARTLSRDDKNTVVEFVRDPNDKSRATIVSIAEHKE